MVELAQQYLRERNVPAQRIFTVSTLEYAQAQREHRAPAGWNELEALISTVARTPKSTWPACSGWNARPYSPPRGPPLASER